MPGFPLPGFFEDGRRQGADLVSQELVMLDAVLLAEAKDHANWSCLAGMVDDLPAGAVRDLSRQPSTRSRCRRTSISNERKTCAANDLPPSHQWTDIVVPLKAEEMMARIKGRFD